MVYGDTNSTLAGALAADKLKIEIAHVEAGLRSFNSRMQEEINRTITDQLSNYLFCPTQIAVDNLKAEGITKGVYFVGDIMYDSLLYNLNIADEKSFILEELSLASKSYYLATVHREQNVDDPGRLKLIMEAFLEIASEDTPVIFPVHPHTKKSLKNIQGKLHKTNSFLRKIEPVSYLDMLKLEENSKVILTDSGGVQKEAYFLKIPCITLREETEWTETLSEGWNLLTGVDKKKIIEAAKNLSLERKHENFFGEGKTADKITSIFEEIRNKKFSHGH